MNTTSTRETPAPNWVLAPVTRLEKEFARFHAANPEVYQELEERARSLVAARAEHFGIALLVESLRFSWALQGRPFRMANAFRSLYARMLLHECPWLDGIMTIRYAPALHGSLRCGDEG